MARRKPQKCSCCQKKNSQALPVPLSALVAARIDTPRFPFAASLTALCLSSGRSLFRIISRRPPGGKCPAFIRQKLALLRPGQARKADANCQNPAALSFRHKYPGGSGAGPPAFGSLWGAAAMGRALYITLCAGHPRSGAFPPAAHSHAPKSGLLQRLACR